MYEEQKVERKKRIYLSGTDLRDRDHGHFNGCGSTFLQLYPGEICQTGSYFQCKSQLYAGKSAAGMVDAGVLADSETEAYNYDASEDKATWEGEIGKKSYKAEYSGKTGEGYILLDDNGTDR